MFATDIDKNTLELAKINAEKNNIKLTTSLGSNFATFDQKFDVIIVNLSQTMLSHETKEELGSLATGVDGGFGGNVKVLKLLHETQSHMHKKSRLYVNVFSISDYKTTIETMHNSFSVKLIAEQSEPVKEFILRDIDWYIPFNNNGLIKIILDEKTNTWNAIQYLFELTLK